MPPTESIEFECPKCHEKSNVTIHKAINATRDPASREALLAGKINEFICPKCDQKGYLLVSLLYHDMDRSFLVQYHPFPAVRNDEFLRQFDVNGRVKLESSELAHEIDKKLKYFTSMHVVFDMAELIRYITFRERLFAIHQAARNQK